MVLYNEDLCFGRGGAVRRWVRQELVGASRCGSVHESGTFGLIGGKAASQPWCSANRYNLCHVRVADVQGKIIETGGENFSNLTKTGRFWLKKRAAPWVDGAGIPFAISIKTVITLRTTG